MKLFEATFRQKSTYYERYFDTEDNKSKFKIIDSSQEYYVEDPNGKYEYFLNPNIKLKKKFGYPVELKYYGLTYPDQRLIRDNYWSKDKSNYNLNPNIWYLDIETTAKNKIDITNTTEEVVLMQIYDTSKNIMIVLGSRDWSAEEKYTKEYDFKIKYVNCKNEINIFNTFFNLIEKLQPLLVLGWNTEGFDYPYLYNRAKKLGLDTNKFSPFKRGTSNLNIRKQPDGRVLYKLVADGIFYMDYMDIYKKYIFKPRSSYSLDNITKVELGEGKVEHNCYSTFDGFRTGESYIFPEDPSKLTDEWEIKMYKLQKEYKENPTQELKNKIREHANDLFVHYGVIDTYRLKQLDDKLRLSKILIMIASKMGVNIPDAMGTVKPWATYINNIAYLENKILPNDEVDENADTSIKGGYVPEPFVGKHNWIISVDINSAYPNLSMRGFNMSAETYVPIKDLPDDFRELNLKYFNDQDEERRFKLYLENPEIFLKYIKLARKYNYSVGVNGAIFKKDKIGLIPRLVGEIYSERKKIKKEMLEWKQKAEIYLDEITRRNIDLNSYHFEIKSNQNIDIKDIKNASDEEIVKAYKYAIYMESQKNTEQMIDKVLINSLYGALGNKFFRLFNVEIARAITANTRFYLHLLNYRISEFLKQKTGKNKRFVLANDTDSAYFGLADIVEKYYDGPDDVIKKTEFLDNWIKKELDPIIEKTNKEFSIILNAFNPDVIKAEREVIADAGIYIAKKRYILRVYDNEGVKYTEDNPYIKTMGVEIVRSSTPAFVQKYLKKSIKIILDKNQSELIEWLDVVKQKFTEQPLADIAKVSSVSSLDYDIRNSKSIPINSRAAIATNEYIQKSEELSKRFTQISAGDKIKLLYLRMPNPIGQNVFAFIDPSFAELFREYVDFDLCWDKYFIKPLNIMITPLGWDVEKRTELLDEW